MIYDVLVIGGGLSGLTAASLLAKRGVSVGVIDKNYNPGGSCGSFKRKGMLIDQGSAMIFGFGEKGFNSHRFVFNCLEEPIQVIKHDLLYAIHYKGKRIKFHSNIKKFAIELGEVFPKEKENILRFYKDLNRLYHNCMVEYPSYTTPDEMDGPNSMKALVKHPLSFAKFLGFMNKNTKELLQGYFTDPEIFAFFDKLTSTYCYTTVEETPAILAAVMFIDNHIGGSYYPAGSSMYLPGKLEKVIETNGGDMLLEKEVESILFEGEKPRGVILKDGTILRSRYLIYSGTVWNLYKHMIPGKLITKEERRWVKSLIPTYPSVVLYGIVKDQVIDDTTQPIEMLIGNPNKLDESEVTVYISSIDDHTICKEGYHTIMAIGPTFGLWFGLDKDEYKARKQKERERLLQVLEKRFPGIEKAMVHVELATPVTLKRYCMKNKGAVAGPKQMLGQHMLNRLYTKSRWSNLFYCGESTVMGTGTPAVTVSGIAAANAVLKRLELEPYLYQEDMTDYVDVIKPPYTKSLREKELQGKYGEIVRKASRCQYCEHPTCMKNNTLDVRGIMRRVTVGNLFGARKIIKNVENPSDITVEALERWETQCILHVKKKAAVAIKDIVEYLK